MKLCGPRNVGASEITPDVGGTRQDKAYGFLGKDAIYGYIWEGKWRIFIHHPCEDGSVRGTNKHAIYRRDEGRSLGSHTLYDDVTYHHIWAYLECERDA